MNNLTDNYIEKLKSTDKRYSITDPGCPGLQLRVSTGGAKSFITELSVDGNHAGHLS